MKFKYRRYYLYYLARIAVFLFYHLPPRIGLYIAGKVGTLAYHILPKYRNITMDNLRHAFGEKEIRELKAIGQRAFENLGKNGFEFLQFPRLNKDKIDRFVEIKNIDILDEALEKGKGVIVVTGHFGNWELLGATLTLKGYSGAAIGRRIYFDKYDRFLNHLRKIREVDIIYRDESPRKALKMLRKSSIIGIVADQDVDSIEGVFVDFFGRPAYTPIGPVALARASGAPLIPVFILRNNGSHTLIFERPIELAETMDAKKDLVENTQKWTSVIESYVRRYPEQWVWMHRRWKTKPEKRGY